MDLFDALPLSALVNNKFLCIHGGISPDIKNVSFHLTRSKILRKLTGLDKFQKVELFVISCELTQLTMIQENFNLQ